MGVVEEEALNGMYERQTQMPMVYLNLHKASEASASSFLQKTSEEQPAAAAASDILRDLDRPVVEEEALNGMYERKTQMPMVYLNLHKKRITSHLSGSILRHRADKNSWMLGV